MRLHHKVVAVTQQTEANEKKIQWKKERMKEKNKATGK